MPVMVTMRFWPFRVSSKPSPGWKPCAMAKASVTTASSCRPGSGSRPSRVISRFISGAPLVGIESTWPIAGLSIPSISRIAKVEIRASTRATPSMAAISGTRLIGARAALDQTSAKRERS